MNRHSHIKAGVAQIDCRLADVSANVDIHAHWILKAKKQNLHLLLFPELSMTGYFLKEKVQDVSMYCEDRRLVQLAQLEPEILVFVGFVAVLAVTGMGASFLPALRAPFYLS